MYGPGGAGVALLMVIAAHLIITQVLEPASLETLGLVFTSCHEYEKLQNAKSFPLQLSTMVRS